MSVIGTGLAYRRQAEGLAQKAGELEDKRDAENQMIKAADKAQQGNLTGMGAAMGWMAGAKAASVGGPMGMLIGAGIGFLAGEIL